MKKPTENSDLTAVEWLFLMLNDPNRNQEFAQKLLDKALELEKEQIIRAYKDGVMVTAISTVRFPSRKSSPAGLPVTDGSPKTPRRSSRSWKASPSGNPYADKAARISLLYFELSAAPRCSGRSIVYLPDL